MNNNTALIDAISIMDAVQDLTSAEIADWIKKLFDAGLIGSMNSIYSVTHLYLELSNSRKKITQQVAVMKAKGKLNKYKANDLATVYPDGGYVYLISNHSTGQHKIGISIDPDKRKKELENASGVPLEIIYAEHVNRPWVLEKELHSKYSKKRKGGEWFVLDSDDVNEIIKIMESASTKEDNKL